jgi:peptidoglycan pentaglycine glycine transferase (the first glycine)
MGRIDRLDACSWNALVAGLPGAHLLQSWQWGMVKEQFGWKPSYLFNQDAQGRVESAAMLMQRNLKLPGVPWQPSVLYVPKGPLLNWQDADLRRQVLGSLEAEARRRGAIFIKIDPDVRLGYGVPGAASSQDDPLGAEILADLQVLGWQPSDEQVQIRNTMTIDLTLPEEALLANMKQKTRYNVRLAERKGVTIRPGVQADLPMLFLMYSETSARDGFVIRDEAYYQVLWTTFMDAGMAEPLVAEVEGQAVAAVVVFRFAGTAWYLNGMSSLAHREMMPNYLLQWEAMRRAKSAGCHTYDLWGAPDVFNESDSMWGVYRFKEGLGAQVIRQAGAWDLPVRPRLYWLYTRAIPRLLAVMRRRGVERTRQMVG